MANHSATAIYTSPSSPSNVEFNAPIKQVIPAGSEPATEERVAYLAELRAGVQSLQSQVNVFLTRKMEEQLQQQQKTVNSGASGAANAKEQAEEEHYGEELVDD